MHIIGKKMARRYVYRYKLLSGNPLTAKDFSGLVALQPTNQPGIQPTNWLTDLTDLNDRHLSLLGILLTRKSMYLSAVWSAH